MFTQDEKNFILVASDFATFGSYPGYVLRDFEAIFGHRMDECDTLHYENGAMQFNDGSIVNDGENEHFGVSWDYDEDGDDVEERYVVLLYHPEILPSAAKGDTTWHSHIEMNEEQAIKLMNWLQAFLDMKEKGREEANR